MLGVIIRGVIIRGVVACGVVIRYAVDRARVGVRASSQRALRTADSSRREGVARSGRFVTSAARDEPEAQE